MSKTWKDRLRGQLPPLWENQIDDFDAQITLRTAGRIDEKIFDIPLGAHRYDGKTPFIESHCTDGTHLLCQNKGPCRLRAHSAALDTFDT